MQITTNGNEDLGTSQEKDIGLGNLIQKMDSGTVSPYGVAMESTDVPQKMEQIRNDTRDY